MRRLLPLPKRRRRLHKPEGAAPGFFSDQSHLTGCGSISAKHLSTGPQVLMSCSPATVSPILARPYSLSNQVREPIFGFFSMPLSAEEVADASQSRNRVRPGFGHAQQPVAPETDSHRVRHTIGHLQQRCEVVPPPAAVPGRAHIPEAAHLQEKDRHAQQSAGAPTARNAVQSTGEEDTQIGRGEVLWGESPCQRQREQVLRVWQDGCEHVPLIAPAFRRWLRPGRDTPGVPNNPGGALVLIA